ncbi:nuclear transport factor 2 family protein [Croceicoccus sp. F390]|uniref:Nuclear transport factor 2 family protein n=1 Tax=Croceicoccus esteveae TaxID=3075597 RepID=A0ABU2ZG56_9SPHN|nr:nuclear transport factor 2 family protein [Croceicoccus sp. F390]MDT0575341.1 nuclear transport factor 2 family protein [Croceicoccus sp. F390]
MLDLQAIELIKRLKYNYCRSIDTCNTAMLREVFAEDAKIDYRGGTYRFEMAGRDGIVDALETAFHKDFIASHTVHMPIIDVDGDHATGKWTLVDYALNLAKNNETTVGAAHYDDEYVHRDGRWQILRSQYERVYERVYHDADPYLTAHMLPDLHAARG